MTHKKKDCLEVNEAEWIPLKDSSNGNQRSKLSLAEIGFKPLGDRIVGLVPSYPRMRK